MTIASSQLEPVPQDTGGVNDNASTSGSFEDEAPLLDDWEYSVGAGAFITRRPRNPLTGKTSSAKYLHPAVKYGDRDNSDPYAYGVVEGSVCPRGTVAHRAADVIQLLEKRFFILTNLLRGWVGRWRARQRYLARGIPVPPLLKVCPRPLPPAHWRPSHGSPSRGGIDRATAEVLAAEADALLAARNAARTEFDGARAPSPDALHRELALVELQELEFRRTVETDEHIGREAVETSIDTDRRHVFMANTGRSLAQLEAAEADLRDGVVLEERSSFALLEDEFTLDAASAQRAAEQRARDAAAHEEESAVQEDEAAKAAAAREAELQRRVAEAEARAAAAEAAALARVEAAERAAVLAEEEARAVAEARAEAIRRAQAEAEAERLAAAAQETSAEEEVVVAEDNEDGDDEFVVAEDGDDDQPSLSAPSEAAPSPIDEPLEVGEAASQQFPAPPTREPPTPDASAREIQRIWRGHRGRTRFSIARPYLEVARARRRLELSGGTNGVGHEFGGRSPPLDVGEEEQEAAAASVRGPRRKAPTGSGLVAVTSTGARVHASKGGRGGGGAGAKGPTGPKASTRGPSRARSGPGGRTVSPRAERRARDGPVVRSPYDEPVGPSRARPYGAPTDISMLLSESVALKKSKAQL